MCRTSQNLSTNPNNASSILRPSVLQSNSTDKIRVCVTHIDIVKLHHQSWASHTTGFIYSLAHFFVPYPFSFASTFWSLFLFEETTASLQHYTTPISFFISLPSYSILLLLLYFALFLSLFPFFCLCYFHLSRLAYLLFDATSLF